MFFWVRFWFLMYCLDVMVLIGFDLDMFRFWWILIKMWCWFGWCGMLIVWICLLIVVVKLSDCCFGVWLNVVSCCFCWFMKIFWCIGVFWLICSWLKSGWWYLVVSFFVLILDGGFLLVCFLKLVFGSLWLFLICCCYGWLRLVILLVIYLCLVVSVVRCCFFVLYGFWKLICGLLCVKLFRCFFRRCFVNVWFMCVCGGCLVCFFWVVCVFWRWWVMVWVIFLCVWILRLVSSDGGCRCLVRVIRSVWCWWLWSWWWNWWFIDVYLNWVICLFWESCCCFFFLLFGVVWFICYWFGFVWWFVVWCMGLLRRFLIGWWIDGWKKVEVWCRLISCVWCFFIGCVILLGVILLMRLSCIMFVICWGMY